MIESFKSILGGMKFIPQLSINNIKQEDWPECQNPLASYKFLKLCEGSGVTSQEQGWQPLHLCLYEKVENHSKLIAVIPSYIKSHSYGEYVFDWAWADFYQRQGMDYYPKIISATPVTPCLAPKLLGNLAMDAQEEWLQAIVSWLNANELSSWHINFDDQSWSLLPQMQDLFERHDIQFHWQNKGYQCFDDFLSRLKPKKRRNILQERRKVGNANWSFITKYTKDVSESEWELFYNLYSHTFAKKSGWAQLNLEFFKGLTSALPNNCIVIFAEQANVIKAGSLFFVSDTHLYGRYWGALEVSDGLHFETCYYQGIELAIKLGLKTFEPGAQGEHKLARGFEPVITKSYHYIANEVTLKPIVRSVESEKRHIKERMEYYRQHSPYR